MADKHLNNTIFLMHMVTRSYCEKYNLSTHEFLELDKSYDILGYVSECSWVFDSMTESEMVEEVDEYMTLNSLG